MHPQDIILNCTLRTTDESLQNFGIVMTKSPTIVYTSLDFTDLEFEKDTAFLNDTPNVINPLLWTLAGEGKSDFLLSLKDNYLVSSLKTLQPGVYNVSLKIKTEECPTFLYATDDEKLDVVAHSLLIWSSLACETCTKFKVCQSFFLNTTDQTMTTFLATLMEAYTVSLIYDDDHRCWSLSNSTLSTTSLDVGNTFGVTTVLACIVVLYGPLLALEFIIQNNPPVKSTQNNTWLRSDSDLPLGAKYSMFYWKENSPYLSAFRAFCCVSFILLVSHWEVILMCGNDNMLSVFYTERRKSAFRYLIQPKAYWSVTIVKYVLILGVFMYCTFKCLYQSGPIDVMFVFTFFKRVFKFRIDPCDKITQNMTWGAKMVTTMNSCIRGPFHLQAVYQSITKFTGTIRLHTFVIVILTACYFPYYILITAPFNVIVVVGLKMFERALRHIRIDCGDFLRQHDCIDCCINIFLVPFCLALLFSSTLFAAFGIVSSFVFSFSNLVIHVYEGFLLNFSEIDPTFFVFWALVSFSYTENRSFYNKYYKLNKIIIQKAREIDKAQNIREPTKMASIKLDMFWHVVNKCQPVAMHAMLSLRNIFAAYFTVSFAFWVLQTVENKTDLSNSIKFMSNILIPFITPLIREFSSSSEAAEKQNIRLESKVEREVKRYHESNNNERLTKEPEELENQDPEVLLDSDTDQEPPAQDIERAAHGQSQGSEGVRLLGMSNGTRYDTF